MSQLLFIKKQLPDNPYDTTSVRISCNAVSLDEVLPVITDFLRACGYTIDYDKELEFVKTWNTKYDAEGDTDQ